MSGQGATFAICTNRGRHMPRKLARWTGPDVDDYFRPSIDRADGTFRRPLFAPPIGADDQLTAWVAPIMMAAGAITKPLIPGFNYDTFLFLCDQCTRRPSVHPDVVQREIDAARRVQPSRFDTSYLD